MVKWQEIDRKNLPILERHYSKFKPYCHLNVVDIWSYRTTRNYWFKVGDTIVYRLNDYNDDSYYLTALGKDSARLAIKELCEKYKSLKKIELRCVPQTTLDALGNWEPIINTTEDANNHDYIFEVKSLVNFSSPELNKKERKYKKISEKYPGLIVKVLDHHRPNDRQKIYRIFNKWVAQTESKGWRKEFLALKRALNLKRKNMVCLGFYDNKKIIGYTVNEPEPNGYYQGFFGKADRSYKSLGLFMERETAKYMSRKYKSKFLNLQPDQGLEGLRKYKTSLGPQAKFKKYNLTINTAKARS